MPVHSHSVCQSTYISHLHRVFLWILSEKTRLAHFKKSPAACLMAESLSFWSFSKATPAVTNREGNSGRGIGKSYQSSVSLDFKHFSTPDFLFSRTRKLCCSPGRMPDQGNILVHSSVLMRDHVVFDLSCLSIKR